MSLLIFLPFLNDLSLHTVCWRAQLNSFHFWTPFATRFVLLRTKQKQFTQIKCKTYIKLTVLIPFSKSEIARVECLTAMSAYKPLTNCRDSPKCQHSLTIYEFCYSPLESARSWGQSPLRDWDPARFLVHPVRAKGCGSTSRVQSHIAGCTRQVYSTMSIYISIYCNDSQHIFLVVPTTTKDFCMQPSTRAPIILWAMYC